MAKVLVLYYSMYGHIETMARAVAEGASKVDGAEVVVKRVPGDSPLQLVFGVIKNPGRRWLNAFAAVARLRVNRGAHGVTNLFVELCQPVTKFPVIQQTGFVKEKLANAVM